MSEIALAIGVITTVIGMIFAVARFRWEREDRIKKQMPETRIKSFTVSEMWAEIRARGGRGILRPGKRIWVGTASTQRLEAMLA